MMRNSPRTQMLKSSERFVPLLIASIMLQVMAMDMGAAITHRLATQPIANATGKRQCPEASRGPSSRRFILSSRPRLRTFAPESHGGGCRRRSIRPSWSWWRSAALSFFCLALAVAAAPPPSLPLRLLLLLRHRRVSSRPAPPPLIRLIPTLRLLPLLLQPLPLRLLLLLHPPPRFASSRSLRHSSTVFGSAW